MQTIIIHPHFHPYIRWWLSTCAADKIQTVISNSPVDAPFLFLFLFLLEQKKGNLPSYIRFTWNPSAKEILILAFILSASPTN